MNSNEYWQECLSNAAQECGVTLAPEQLAYLAEAVEGAHENYGMAFYSPPPSDRISAIEREHFSKLEALQKQFDAYRGNAETAIKKALHQYPDDQVGIGEHGEVFRYGGRTTQIQ